MTGDRLDEEGTLQQDDFRVKGLHLIVHYQRSGSYARVLFNTYPGGRRVTVGQRGLGLPLRGVNLDSGPAVSVVRATLEALLAALPED